VTYFIFLFLAKESRLDKTIALSNVCMQKNTIGIYPKKFRISQFFIAKKMRLVFYCKMENAIPKK
jgi:hypothetical protein